MFAHLSQPVRLKQRGGLSSDVTDSILFEKVFKVFACEVAAIVCNDDFWKAVHWISGSQWSHLMLTYSLETYPSTWSGYLSR